MVLLFGRYQLTKQDLLSKQKCKSTHELYLMLTMLTKNCGQKAFVSRRRWCPMVTHFLETTAAGLKSFCTELKL